MTATSNSSSRLLTLKPCNFELARLHSKDASVKCDMVCHLLEPPDCMTLNRITLQQSWTRGHLVLEGDLIGPEVACILVVMVQQGHSGAGAIVQELHAQHLQLIHTDVEGLMEAH